MPALKKQLAGILKQPEEFLKEADAAKKEQKESPSATPKGSKEQDKAKGAAGPDKAELVRSTSNTVICSISSRLLLAPRCTEVITL